MEAGRYSAGISCRHIGVGSYEVEPVKWRDGATLLLLGLAVAGWSWHVHRAVPASLAEVAREMEMVSPELWPLPLPGLRLEWPPLLEGQQNRVQELGLDLRLITGEGGLEAVEREQLRAVMAELPAIWGGWPTPDFRTGAAQLVLRLAAPGAHPRAIVALRGGTGHGRGILYRVEQRTDGWQTEPLDSLAEHVAILDLDADQRPEVVASGIYGSGHFLHLNIFAWDDQTVRKVFTYGGRGESGPFGFLLRPDGARDLWLEEVPWGGGERGLFTAPYVATHGPFLRDRVYWRWEGGSYQPAGRARVATPFYFLNRYLYLAGRREWAKAAAYAEPGAAIDRDLAAALGHGPFRGGRDDGFVNGRMYFWKGEEPFFAGRHLDCHLQLSPGARRDAPGGRIAGAGARRPSASPQSPAPDPGRGPETGEVPGLRPRRSAGGTHRRATHRRGVSR